jgi:phage gp46-like protein
LTFMSHPVDASTVAIWRMDETHPTDNAVDASGNGHTATCQGSVNCYTTGGKIDGARGSFSGANYFQWSNDWKPTAFTIACWSYDGSVGNASTQMLVQRYNSSADVYPNPDAASVSLRHGGNAQGGKPHAELYFGGVIGKKTLQYTGSPLTSSVWHHIGLAWDGATAALYVNGQIGAQLNVGAHPIAYGTTAAETHWHIGAGYDGLIHTFYTPAARVDDVAFYSEAKSLTWFQDAYAGDFPPAVTPAAEVNEGEGWLINDDGDYETTSDGRWKRDPTIATRCLIRLKTRRGEWFADPTLGSRLHTLKNTKNAFRRAKDYVLEALAPLVSEGAIHAIDVVPLDSDPAPHVLMIEVLVTLPDDSMVSVAELAIGASR